MLQRILEYYDCKVVTANSADEAIERLKDKSGTNHEPFKLAIVDYNMPDRDGLDFLRQIRASRSLKSLPVVMLSSTGDANEADALDIEAWVFKPIHRRQFVQLLDQDVLGKGKKKKGEDSSSGSTTRVLGSQYGQHRATGRALSGLVCLVVDDNDTNVLVMSRMLRMLGCETVVTATSGKEVRRFVFFFFFNLNCLKF